MTTQIDSRVTLTTEHPSSSYGIPVAIIDGVAYGAGDVAPDGFGGQMVVGDALAFHADFSRRPAGMSGFKFSAVGGSGISEEQLSAIRVFCASNPAGRQPQ